MAGDGSYLGEAYLELDVDLGPYDRGLDRAEARLVAEAAAMDSISEAASRKVGGNLGKIGPQVEKEVVGPVQRAQQAVAKSGHDAEASLQRVQQQAGRTAETQKRATADQVRQREQLAAAEKRLADVEADAARARQAAIKTDRYLTDEYLETYKEFLEAQQKSQGKELSRQQKQMVNEAMQQRRDLATANRDVAREREHEARDIRTLIQEMQSLNDEQERTVELHDRLGRLRRERGQVIQKIDAGGGDSAARAAAEESIRRVDSRLMAAAEQMRQVVGVLEERQKILDKIAQGTPTGTLDFFSQRHRAEEEASRARSANRLAEVMGQPYQAPRVEGTGGSLTPVGGPGADYRPRVSFAPPPASPISPEAKLQAEERVRAFEAAMASHPRMGTVPAMSSLEGIKGPTHPGSKMNPAVVVVKSGQSAGMSASEAAAAENASVSDAGGPDRAKRAGTAGSLPLERTHAGPITVDLSDNTMAEFSALLDDHLVEPLSRLMERTGIRQASSAAVPNRYEMESHGGIHSLFDVSGAERKKLAESHDLGVIKAALAQHQLGQTRAEMSPLAAATRIERGAALAPGDRPRGEDRKFLSNAAILEQAKAERENTRALHEATLAWHRELTGGWDQTPVAAGGGGGGGGLPPVALGGGGGGGGESMFPSAAHLFMGRKSHHGRPPGWFGYLLGPAIGAGAAIGSPASFAGFGTEHVLTTLGGIAGSGLAGAAGAGVAATGALGTMAVGGGSDMAVMRSTIKDTKELATSYGKVQEAVAKYGAGSKQAVVAQNALNFQMKELGNNAGVKAELGLAKASRALGLFWDQQTSGARVQAVKVLGQVLDLGHTYVPLVAKAAEQNLSIINHGLKPLFGWLKGPEGMGIFNTLERRFAQNLPTAIHAFDMGIEFMLKTMAEASKYTGGLTQSVDRFLTKLNSPQGFSKWRDEMGRLIGTMHEWGRFIKILGLDLRDLFINDAQTGTSIVHSLTEMLTKIHEWEVSTKGKSELHNIFVVHKEEVLALMRAFAPLAGIFTQIYMTLAPPLTKAVTEIAKAFAAVLEQITKLGPIARDVLGGALVAWKLVGTAGMISAVRSVAAAFGLVADKQKLIAETTGPQMAASMKTQAAATSVATGASTKLAAAETEAAYAPYAIPGFGKTKVPGFGNRAMVPGLGPSGITAAAQDAALGLTPVAAAGLGARLKGMTAGLGPKLIRGAAGGAAAGFGVDMALNMIGVKGPTNTILSTGAAGAAFGLQFGGPWGAAAGGLIGAGLGAAMTLFNHKAKDYGKNFARGFVDPLAPMLTQRTADELQAGLHHQRNQVVKARSAVKAIVDEKAAIDASGATPEAKAQFDREAGPRYNKAFNKAFISELREGLMLSEGFKKAFDGVSQKSVHSLVAGIGPGLRQMSGEARKAAAQAMVAYAAELEHKGELPKHSVGKVIAQLEHQFPELVSYFRSHALAASAQVAAAMKMQRAESNLATALNNLRAEWGLFTVDKNVTGKNWVSNSGKALAELKAIYNSSTGDARDKAHKHILDLEHKTNTTFGKMLGSTKTNMDHWGKLVRGGLATAPASAEAELGKFVEKIQEAEQAGAISAQLGAKLIADATNSELTALGGAKIPVPKVKPVNLVQGSHGGGKGAAFGPELAGGALLQVGQRGEAGHDNVPLNVGGTPIVVGAGEQVAVFNRHQQAVMDHALGHVGGLPGLFNSVTTPHFMAQGGLVNMIRTADSIDHRHYPYLWGGGHGGFSGPYDCSGAVSAVLHAGGALGAPRVASGFKNYGLPGAGAVSIYASDGHVYMSLDGKFWGTSQSNPGGGAGWFNGAPRAGFTVRHVPDRMLGEGIGTIKAPGVSGTGGVAAGVRAGLRKVAAAANRKVSAAQAKAMAGAFGGGDVGEGGKGKAGSSAQMRAWAAAGLRAAGLPASAGNINAVLYTMQHESGGNPRSENTTDSNARAGHPSRGLMELIPENFRKYHVPGTSMNVFDPVANVAAAVRYMIARYGHVVAKSPYAEGGLVTGMRRMAAGGLLNLAPGGKVPVAIAARRAPKAKKVKPPPPQKRPKSSHIRRPANAKQLSLGKLTTSLSQIPEFAGIAASLTPLEMNFNALSNEQGIVGEMTANPGTLLDSDMSYLTPLLGQLPGLDIGSGMLAPMGERHAAQYGLDHGESTQLTEVQSLVQWIGGLDDHKLISPLQKGLLKAKGFIPFAAGSQVVWAEKVLLEAQIKVQEIIKKREAGEITVAKEVIRNRQKRLAHLRNLLAATYRRYHALKRRLEQTRLKATLGLYARTEATDRAKEERAAVQAALANERTLPKKERNEQLIHDLTAQEGNLSRHIAHMQHPSKAPVIEAELKAQIHPLEDRLHMLGGASTRIGKAGLAGEVVKQIKSLTKGKEELQDQKEITETSTIPKLQVALGSLKQQIAETSESVRPPKVAVPAAEKSATSETDAEKAALLKTKNEQLALALAVSQRQYAVLAQLPKFGGHFAQGGIVPGQMGEPRTIIAHAGETISKAGAAPQVQVHFADGMGWLKQFVSIRVSEGTRKSAREAFRSLPSRGGGEI